MKSIAIAITALLAFPGRFVHAEDAKKTKIVFVAGRASHGRGQHEHKAGSMLLARLLNENMPNVNAIVTTGGWPQANDIFAGAAVVVVYCDGGGRHVLNRNLKFMDGLSAEGVGLVCIHYGVEVPKGPPGDHFLKWIGGYFEAHWSVNPHWTAEIKALPDHPISRGVKPFKINDEWYYHMRFREGMKGVTPILSAHPPKETLRRKDGAHSGNPQVRKAVAAGEIQHVGWASENESGSRGFGFTGGHFHRNWKEDNFRKVMLNAIVWAAKLEVPSGGVPSKAPTAEEMEANMDGKGAKISPPKNIKTSKAKFSSPVVTHRIKNHSVDVETDIKKAKKLYLVITNGGNGISHDWADWIEPTLIGEAGERKLTDLKWKSASTGWGKVNINRNVGGQRMVVGGKPVAWGIGAHATSIIEYDVPPGYSKFKARGGLDKGGVGRSTVASVQFHVFTQKPANLPSGGQRQRPSSSIDTGVKFVPVESFKVVDDLEITVWATSPMFYNPTNIDIDAKGRVWVAEGVNYRGSARGVRVDHKGGGDRIVVLEDSTGDGKADKSHVFVQDRELIAPLGVAVIDNRIVVSQPPSLLVYTDVNRDLKFDPKVDKKEALLTGFGGRNHDHSLHSVTVGPDGEWYFNTGNAGNPVVKDKEGFVLKAGSPYGGGSRIAGQPSSDGHVYIGGLTMRMKPDGTGLRCIAYNFRNSYEQTVSSFGDVFGNDNDDPSACRTTWLMEYGNLGFASADGRRSWRADQRPGQPTAIAEWRQEDPGTIPAGDVYGAGAPTGIVFYENGALGQKYPGLLLSCEPALNTIFGYNPAPTGAGYTLERFIFLTSNPDRQYFGTDTTRRRRGFGKANTYFRPSDIAIGPDGAIYIADWFDPQVGGHGARDMAGAGTIYRIAPKGAKLSSPPFDLNTTEGQITALKSPAVNVRALGFYKLKEQGVKALPAVKALLSDEFKYFRARAIWLMAQLGDEGRGEVAKLLKDNDAETRIIAFRALRRANHKLLEHVVALASDSSPAVRREVALAMRDVSLEDCREILLKIAEGYDGKDRWYLEALGTGCAKKEEAMFAAIQEKLGGPALEWDARFAGIAWRLHPPQIVPQLKLRAMTANLPLAERKKTLTALAFIQNENAAYAMVDIAQKGPADLRGMASWWVKNRHHSYWRPFNAVARLSGKKALPPTLPKIDLATLADDLGLEVDEEKKDLPPIREIAEMKGDAKNGLALFHGKAKCATCHMVKDKGQSIGPDLTAAGRKFGSEVILDSILNPSSAISFGYEGTVIVTEDEEIFSGIVVGDGDLVLLKDLKGEQHGIEKKEIKHRKKMPKSLMPSFRGVLSTEELADVVAYLRSVE